MKRVFFVVGFFVALLSFILVQAFVPLKFGANAADDKEWLGVGAKSSYLFEVNTGTILYKNNENQKLPMASMTKMMTLKILFDELENGKFIENDLVLVSDYAASQEGSQAFLDAGKQYRLGDLLKTTIVASANDSAVAIAELVSGCEEGFVERMNNECVKMGLNSTHFANATGLPSADHYSTAADMAKLASVVVPNAYYKKYSKIYLDELVHESGRKTQLVNTNRSLKNYVGFEGGKTGHTQEAGYCMAAVARRGDMELVAVVMGEDSSRQRASDITEMFDYGFNNFKTKEIVSSTKPIEEITVESGKKREIPIFAKKAFVVFMNKNDKFDYKIRKDIKNISAPVAKGEKVGTLSVVSNNEVIFETDLVAGEKSDHIGLWKTYRNLVEKF